MSEITTPRELFLHELGDILYVERALVAEALPKLIGEVQDDEFRTGLEKHLKQSRQHVANVESVFESLDEEPEVEESADQEPVAEVAESSGDGGAPGAEETVTAAEEQTTE